MSPFTFAFAHNRFSSSTLLCAKLVGLIIMHRHFCYYFKFCYVCQEKKKKEKKHKELGLTFCFSSRRMARSQRPQCRCFALSCWQGELFVAHFQCWALIGKFCALLGITGPNWTCHCVPIVLYGTMLIDEVCIASFCRASLQDFKGRAPIVATSLCFV